MTFALQVLVKAHANLTDWLEVTREDGVKGRRETNTMPQWLVQAGTTWLYRSTY